MLICSVGIFDVGKKAVCTYNIGKSFFQNVTTMVTLKSCLDYPTPTVLSLPNTIQLLFTQHQVADEVPLSYK